VRMASVRPCKTDLVNPCLYIDLIRPVMRSDGHTVEGTVLTYRADRGTPPGKPPGQTRPG
jgi:hypothetical protein